jgi:cobalt-zinc-cadmium resistance protein CzcA
LGSQRERGAAPHAFAKQVQAAIRNIRGATDVKTEQVAGLPILTVKLDRQALFRYGLSVG